MSKGLEVWNDVKKYLNFFHHRVGNENSDVKMVEGMPIDIIEKELKAIQIIKSKNCIDIELLKWADYENYHYWKTSKVDDLTKNEFNLLKEVLEDEQTKRR